MYTINSVVLTLSINLDHHFNEAADLYTKAIEINPKDATLWCNRAYTRIKLEEHGYGLADATTAIELDPKYAKAYYRFVCRFFACQPYLLTQIVKAGNLLPSDIEVQAGYRRLP